MCDDIRYISILRVRFLFSVVVIFLVRSDKQLRLIEN